MDEYTLGAISIDGAVVVPALTVSDLPYGIHKTAIAEKIRSLVGNGYTASRVNNVVTISAPAGLLEYNGKTVVVAPGTSQALVSAVYSTPPAAPANGQLTITSTVRAASTLQITCGIHPVTDTMTSPNVAVAGRLDDLFTKLHAGFSFGYSFSCVKVGSPTTSLNCSVSAPAGVSKCATFSLTSITETSNTGLTGGSDGVASTPQSGWTDLSSALTITSPMSGAVQTVVSGNTCANGTAKCTFIEHIHGFDDYYNRSGVNFLNSAEPKLNISKIVPYPTISFKVLMQNQYLNPAAKLHIGDSGYLPKVDSGYVAVKNFQTTATLDLATLPTYTTATIGSLALNFPQNVFDNNDWWGGVLGLPTDVRDGMHPTEYPCPVISFDKTQDGNMYQPIVPPATVTADGNGTLGYNAGTTQTTATGVRHNGALTIQIIKDTTTNSDIELAVAGMPEYGWRVKAGSFSTYVIGEYSVFHHTKHLGICYGAAGWTKIPTSDNRICGGTDSATTKLCTNFAPSPVLGTDPQIGPPAN